MHLIDDRTSNLDSANKYCHSVEGNGKDRLLYMLAKGRACAANHDQCPHRPQPFMEVEQLIPPRQSRPYPLLPPTSDSKDPVSRVGDKTKRPCM